MVISENEDDDHHQELNHRAFSAPLGLSPYRNLSSSPFQQHDNREKVVTTPHLEIANNNVVVSTLIDKGIACITPVSNNTLKECRVSLIPKEIPRLLMCVKTKREGNDDDGKDKAIASPNLSIPVSQPMQTRRSSRNSTSYGEEHIAVLDANDQAKRISHPKLDSPLPDGCHGKTSRTQSFCRRGPNYNGSNFCKLHYFDPRYNDATSSTRSTNSTPEEAKRMCQKTPETSNNDSSNYETTTAVRISDNSNLSFPLPRNTGETVPSKIANNELESLSTKKQKSNPRQKRAPRDKLYRGPTGNSAGEESSEVEVRCLAISTRGKRCCYTAVACNGNEYCHRHSSFFASANGKENSVDAKDTAKSEENKNSNDTTYTKETSKNFSSPRRNRSLAASLQKAPLAALSDQRAPKALSDLSTDLWQNRRVVISKGPHESKIGNVVRWRNGWVTVELLSGQRQDKQKASTTTKEKNDKPPKSKIPVFHNRRSYELILV